MPRLVDVFPSTVTTTFSRTSVSSVNNNKMTNAKEAAEQAASHRATHGELFREVFLPIAGCLCDGGGKKGLG